MTLFITFFLKSQLCFTCSKGIVVYLELGALREEERDDDAPSKAPHSRHEDSGAGHVEGDQSTMAF